MGGGGKELCGGLRDGGEPLTDPGASIVVPAGRTDMADRCLSWLLRMHGDYEVIVVLRLGEEYFHKDTRVCVINQDGKGVSNARNCGVRAARGKIIAFTDDDCIVAHDWLERLLRPFSDPQVGGAGSIREALNVEEPLAEMWDLSYITIGGLKEKYDRLRKTDTYLCTSSAAFRADVINALGGFDETLPSGEDYDLSMRIKDAGFRLALVPGARVRHIHPATWREMIRQQLWFGRGDLALAKKYRKKYLRLRMLASVPYYTLLSLPAALKLKSIKKTVTFPAFVLIRTFARFVGTLTPA